MKRLLSLTVLALTACAAPSFGQTMSAAPQPVCAAIDANLPASFAPWAMKGLLTAAKDQKGLSAAALTPGKAVAAGLSRTAQVKFVKLPEKPGGSVSYGGMVSFKITEAGTYRVALNSGAWIDVLEDGKALESTDHGHGPDCSTLRKIVDFPLKAGAHVLQISANADPMIGVMIVRKP